MGSDYTIINEQGAALMVTKNFSPVASAPMESSTYRQQAERCRRLARSVNDPDARARLLELAAEYEAKASAADNTSKPGTAD